MKFNPIVYLNGHWTKQSKAMIPITDGGFLYGDGLFETIRFQNRCLFRPENHFKRLRNGMQILGLYLEIPDHQLRALLDESIARNRLENGLLRVVITRGSITTAPWIQSGKPSVYILPRLLSPVPPFPVKIIWVKETAYPLIRYKPAIKSVNYLGNMMAKKDAEAANAFEPIFIDRDGFITEGAIRNIFFVRKKTVVTPDLNLGVLPGVMRETIIEVVKQLNLDFHEECIPQTEVNRMNEAFISSTGIGVLPCYWEGWISDYQVTNAIKNRIDKALSTHSIKDE